MAPVSDLIDLDDWCEPEWSEWYRLTPAERWSASCRLWRTFVELGGSLDPEPDTQSFLRCGGTVCSAS